MATLHKTLIACALAGFIGQAHAQSISSEIQTLERAHEADEAERRPIPEMKPPISRQQEKFYTPRRIWECAGTNPWEKVYSRPDTNSPVIGRTQPEVAITGNPENGFITVLFYNGQIGYLPANLVHPYQAWRTPSNIILTCTFVGLSDTGRPKFRFDRRIYGR